MTIKDIEKFINAGFTAEEIKKLFKETMTGERKKPKQSAQTDNDFKSALEALNGEIKSLKELVQDSNIRNADSDIKDDSVDDILASIINPNKGDK